MYRELKPLRQALSVELKANLPPVGLGVDPEVLLQTYLDRLTLYVGVDVADQTFTVVVLDASGELVGEREQLPNTPDGFAQAWQWLDHLRQGQHARLLVVAMESTGVYYWGWWDYLATCPHVARVLYNARTTEHMTEVLSKKVRNDLVDGYALAEQVRLGATPEVVLSEDAELLTARFCSRVARDLAQQLNRQKNQLRSVVRAYNPVFSQVFRGSKFHHPAAYALLKQYVFPEDFITASVEAITTDLLSHCRTAFAPEDAVRLLQLCRQVTSRDIGQPVIRQYVQHLIADIETVIDRQSHFLDTGYALIATRPETTLLRQTTGAGRSNTLALVSETGEVRRFPSGAHLASFFGLTTSKPISGTTLFLSKHITKQGSPNARYAAVNLALHLSHRVPKYQEMYQRIKKRKPRRQGHFIALVAVARDFVTNILYDMWRDQRPFFLKVEDYRAYRQAHPRAQN